MVEACECTKFANCVFKGNVNFATFSSADLSRYYVHANKCIRKSGKFNFEFCKFPVPTPWNVDRFETLLRKFKYHDLELLTFLHFGWPIDTMEVQKLEYFPPNQKGARENLDSLEQYVRSEMENKSIIGPFNSDPFRKEARFLPLDSIPKRDSHERRVILNLSYPPEGSSVNDAVSKDLYLGKPTNLTYPSVDDLVSMIHKVGVGAALINTDLKKYFRQVYYNPGSIHLAGYRIGTRMFWDVCLSMGLRIACYIAQRLSNAIIFIYNNLHPDNAGVNYIDDLAAVARWSRAFEAYDQLLELLEFLNVWESKNKRCPNVLMNFLGISVNSLKMLLCLTDDRLVELKVELEKWRNKESASKRDLQSLIGETQLRLHHSEVREIVFLQNHHLHEVGT